METCCSILAAVKFSGKKLLWRQSSKCNSKSVPLFFTYHCNLDVGTPRPNLVDRVRARPACFEIRVHWFRMTCAVDVNIWRRTRPPAFRLGVYQIKLVICLLIVIETSGGALCFFPSKTRQKLLTVFRTAENSHHLHRPGTNQKLIPSEPKTHF